jgi:hypothetical protein
MWNFWAVSATDDTRSWALRMVHYGLIAAILAMGIIVLLLLQNFYIMHSLKKLRRQIQALTRRLNEPWKGSEN